VSDRCSTCLRPFFRPRPTEPKPDPLKHCPRALATIGEPDSHTHYAIACLSVGICARDAEIEKLKADLARELGNFSELEQQLAELKRDREAGRG
jgi:hypothetical protein